MTIPPDNHTPPAGGADRHARRILDLAGRLLEYRSAYYAGKPEISDVEYDALEDRLRQLAPDHPVLGMVGAEPADGTKKASHRLPMLSLAKTYAWEELEAWRADRPVVGALKIDGNSLSLVYQGGKLRLAKTRGNGRVGEVVTEKVRWVPSVPQRLQDQRDLEVRGELYCTNRDFARLADEMAAKGLERPTSPRNVVAGILGRKEHFEFARYFGFFAFDILLADEPGSRAFVSETAKLRYLADLGFDLPESELCVDSGQLRSYLDKTQVLIEAGDIAIDGAVLTLEDLSLHEQLGNTSHHPRYRMSFKWQGSTADSEIREIQWSTSRLGAVTPVAVIDPVNLSGAMITNVTLHNAAFVRQNNLKKGDRIQIVRSGEVIPKFLGVVEPAVGEAVLPAACPSCGAALVDDVVRLCCPNAAECPAQRLLGILNWVQVINIDDLSDKRLAQMVDAGLVQDIPDLYRLSVKELLGLPLVKEKMAQKLFDNIQRSREPELASFLAALGVVGAGKASWESLLEAFPSLESVRSATAEQLAAVRGFAEKSAIAIFASLAAKRQLIDALLESGVRPRNPQLPATGAVKPLSGMTFVLTGALSRPRKEIENLIKAAGGKPTSAVSSQTTALVCEDEASTSSKAKKARELGVAVWSEAMLIQKIEGA